MDKAITSLGGLVLGIMLIILALIIISVAKLLKTKNKKSEINSSAKKSFRILTIAGIAVFVISGIYMFATGSAGNVGELLSAMRSTEKVIYNDHTYYKSEFVFNTTTEKYTLTDAEDVTTGVNNLQNLKGYDRFDIFVNEETNISGGIFVRDDQQEEFNSYYTDYENNFRTGAILDKQDKDMTVTDKKASAEFFSKIADKKNYKETDEDNVYYSEKIANTKCCIFWATSKDELVNTQIRVYPKDNNDKYIVALADGEDMIFYELESSLNSTLDTYFK